MLRCIYEELQLGSDVERLLLYQFLFRKRAFARVALSGIRKFTRFVSGHGEAPIHVTK
jgi:hypothetical protein